MTKNQYTFSVRIDASCINCDMCVPECPSDSIAMDGKHYQINSDTCIRCEHYYDSPNCVEVCPIDSVIVDKKDKSLRQFVPLLAIQK